MGDGTGHFRIAEGKGDIHDNDKKGRDGQAQRAPLRQAEVPAKVVAGDHIADAQSPKHKRAERFLELRIVMFHLCDTGFGLCWAIAN